MARSNRAASRHCGSPAIRRASRIFAREDARGVTFVSPARPGIRLEIPEIF
jgi:hypothetical protein